ncbi:phenylcoumaran benzylic ether reductase POP1 isoform X2 [Lactuca sativa]|uniref:phenylcoumaran benzylic ether reductase POP1 isoform X2 n=1 Tax=Lactuca sativa TaxID=4236 RepID=UPI000CB0A925|nr:phenylcoumaran benzylic ether reductase POP1 isoform X2 [Lactuca sativa]
MGEKSKILLIGGTGYIGKFIVETSAKSGHPTFLLIRGPTLLNPSKSSMLDSFKKSGVTFITGDLYDHDSLVRAVKQVDVVISTVGPAQFGDQVNIIAAIKAAGNVRKFYPSEFGNDVDRTHAVGPAKTAFATKAQIRRAIEAEGIPYTYIVNNCFDGYFLPSLAQPEATAPPLDKVVIFGDGDTKAVFNEEHDIATYTIQTIDDPRTLNKIVYIKPSCNVYSFHDLVSLWEKKIGKTLERVYLCESQVLKNLEESPAPLKKNLSIWHSVFVKGDQTNFEIEPSVGVEASTLYPDVKYVTVDEYLSRFV